MQKPLIKVIAAVASRGESLLVCQRPHGKRHGGLWEFPGGKLETGESMYDAVCRELREELDVEVVQMGQVEFTIQDADSQFLISFVPVSIVGEPTCREHISLLWGKPSELEALHLAPSDRRYLEFCHKKT